MALVDPKRKIFQKQVKKIKKKYDASKKYLFDSYFEHKKVVCDRYGEDYCHWKNCDVKNEKMGVCNGCQSVLYCCMEHQRKDRKVHKKFCQKIQKSKDTEFIRQ
jgi:hypothetical protein